MWPDSLTRGGVDGKHLRMIDQEDALAYVISQMESYTKPSRLKRRERNPKQASFKALLCVKKVFPTVYRFLSNGAFTVTALLEICHLEKTDSNVLALKWIVRCLCDEETRYNDEVGYNTRGHWRLKHRLPSE